MAKYGENEGKSFKLIKAVESKLKDEIVMFNKRSESRYNFQKIYKKAFKIKFAW